MKEVSDAEAAIEEALAKLDIDYIMKYYRKTLIRR